MHDCCFALGEGWVLLDALSAVNNAKLAELWHDLTKNGFSIHAEVEVALTQHSSAATVLSLKVIAMSVTRRLPRRP